MRLHRIEALGATQKVMSKAYRLATYRTAQPRNFADERAALDAFDLEVITSLQDPLVIEMQRRGLVD